MSDLQDRLSEGLRPEDSAVVNRWLTGLSLANRQELEVLWDKRGDHCSRSLEFDEDGRPFWHSLPIIRGRFLRPGEVADDEEWRADHLEYLLDHPEIWVFDHPPELGSLGVPTCTAHQGAREVLAKGLIPADFDCPLDHDQCPLRKILLLAPGRSFRLMGPQGFMETPDVSSYPPGA